MFSKFKLNDIAYSDFEKYESEGKEYYEKTKTDIQNSLKEFIGKDGVVDGSGLQESWFSTKQKFDVFLSLLEILICHFYPTHIPMRS